MAGIRIATDPAEIMAVEDKLNDELARRAVQQKAIAATSNIVIRDILPDIDLGAANRVWTQTYAAAFTGTAIYSGNLATASTKKLLGFMGVKDTFANPLVTSIQFALGPTSPIVKDILEPEDAWEELNTIGLMSEPIIYNKDEFFTITGQAKLAGTDGLILLGNVAEARGGTIAGGLAELQPG